MRCKAWAMKWMNNMITKTDIEILFSDHSQALKASEFAKAMIFVYYQNGYEFAISFKVSPVKR